MEHVVTSPCYLCNAAADRVSPSGMPLCRSCARLDEPDLEVTAPKPRVVQLAATQQEVITWIVETATRVLRCGGQPYGAILGPIAWAKLQGVDAYGIGDIRIWTPAGSVKVTTDVNLPNYAIHVVDKETWDMITTGSNTNVRPALSSALSVAISNASMPLGLKGSHEIAAELRGTPPGASPCARVIDAFFGVDRTVPLENPDAKSIQEYILEMAALIRKHGKKPQGFYGRGLAEQLLVDQLSMEPSPPFRGTIRFPNPVHQPRPLHSRHQVEPVRVKLDISEDAYRQRKAEQCERRMVAEEARLNVDRNDGIGSDGIECRIRYWRDTHFPSSIAYPPVFIDPV